MDSALALNLQGMPTHNRFDNVSACFSFNPGSHKQPSDGDEYGFRDVASRPPRPLPIGTFLDQKDWMASRSSKLLQLPDHILDDIVDYLMLAVADHDTAARKGLSSLALANSACRHLSHAARFCCVTFNYSERSRGFAQIILDEDLIDENIAATHHHSRLRLRPYIRQATFSPSRRHMIARHIELYNTVSVHITDRPGHPDHGFPNRGLGSSPDHVRRRNEWYGNERQRQQRLEDGACALYNATRKTVVDALAALSSLPNSGLRTLVWCDTVGAGFDEFQKLAAIPAQHVRIQHLSFTEYAPWVTPPSLLNTPLTPWPIRSLSLNIRCIQLLQRHKLPPFGRSSVPDQIHETSSAYSALFEMCAPTLEKLYWRSINPLQAASEVISLAREKWKEPSMILSVSSPSFPCLRSLVLDRVIVDEAAFTAFLSAPHLRHLALSVDVIDKFACILNKVEPRLETFVACIRCANLGLPTTDPGSSNTPDVVFFLEKQAASGNLTKLCLLDIDPIRPPGSARSERSSFGSSAVDPRFAPQSALDVYVLPLLEKEHPSNDCIAPKLLFHPLQSLSLSWLFHVSDRSLAAIGRFTNLRQLCLSSSGSRTVATPFVPWVVDHTTVGYHLRGLVHLEKLAFVGDNYSEPGLSTTPSTFLAYYRDPVMTPGLAAFSNYYLTDSDKVNMAIDAMHRDVNGDDNNNNNNNVNRDNIRARTGNDRRAPINVLRWHPVMLQGDAEEDEAQHVRTKNLDVAKRRRTHASIWERAHRNRMLAYAEDYAKQLPSLEWVYLGQRPIGITRTDDNADVDGDGKGACVQAKPLTEHRDYCTAYLRATFELGSGF